MRQNYLIRSMALKLIILGVFLAFCFNMEAKNQEKQPTILSDGSILSHQTFPSFKNNKREFTNLSKTKTQSPDFKTRASEGPTYSLDFDLSYPDNYNYWGCVIRNQDGEPFAPDWYTDLCLVPEGKYDMVFFFSDDETGIDHYVVREEVEINSDTVIPIDAAEATIKVEFKDYLPNGEEVKPWVLKLNDNYEYEVEEVGTMSNPWYDSTNCLNINGYNCIISGGNMPGDIFYPDGSVMWDFKNSVGTIYINQVSSRVGISHVELFTFDNRLDIIETYREGGNENMVTNEGLTFNEFLTEFTHSPSFSTIEDQLTDDYNKYTFYYSFSNNGGSHQLFSNYPEFQRPLICKGSTQSQNILMMRLGEINYIGEDAYGWPLSYYTLTNEYAYLKEDSYLNVMRNMLYTSEMNDDNESFNLFMENPFAFNASDNQIANGASCPFWRSANVEVYGNNYINLTSIGLLGEEREADIPFAKVNEVSVNNEKIEVNISRENLLQLSLPNVENGQEWVVDLSNDNIDVNGIKGFSDYYVNFTIDDNYEMPVLQQVQLLNNEGIAINSFDNVDEGVLNIALGNFSFHSYTPEGEYLPITWFECSETIPEFTVSYAAHGADEWYPLDMNEIDDDFYPDGMGHFFTCPLNDIKIVSETGWYDLKVELEAANGNVMIQKFGPLFNIKNVSSVGTILQDEVSSKISEDSIIYDLQGMQHNASNLKAGIYIVKTNDSIKKIIVK